MHDSGIRPRWSLLHRAVQHAARPRVGHLPALERDLPVDDDEGDAFGITVRLLECRGVADTVKSWLNSDRLGYTMATRSSGCIALRNDVIISLMGTMLDAERDHMTNTNAR